MTKNLWQILESGLKKMMDFARVEFRRFQKTNVCAKSLENKNQESVIVDYTSKVDDRFIINKYVSGDPLSEENLDIVLDLVSSLRKGKLNAIYSTERDKTHNMLIEKYNRIRILFNNSKTIWLYSGYKYNDIVTYKAPKIDIDNPIEWVNWNKRNEIISLCDVMVDGQFEKDKADLSYPYAGSTNQRVIDVQKSLTQGNVVRYKTGD